MLQTIIDYIHIVLYVCVFVFLAVFLYKRKKKPIVAGCPELNLHDFRNNRSGFAPSLQQAAYNTKSKFVIVSSPMDKDVLVAAHPDVLKDVLREEVVFPRSIVGLRNLFHYVLKDSLLFGNGEYAKHVRSTVSPGFHFDSLKELIPMFIGKSEELLAKLPVGETFNARPDLAHFTVDTLGIAAFGINFNTINEGDKHEYYAAYIQLMTETRKRFFNFIPMWLEDKLPLKSVRERRAATDKLFAMTRKVMEERKNAGDDKKTYILDLMLSAHPPLSGPQLEGNTLLMFLAGNETTNGSLNWAVHFLASHPEIQKRLRDEVDTVLKGKHIDGESMKELVYLDMFLKEVLRYGCPVSWLGIRVCAADVYIDSYFIPKNTPIAIGIHAVHFNKDFWPNPEVFDPERFSAKNCVRMHPFAYLPFSLGKRACIGNQFSIIEQKVFLSMLVQRYIITTNDKGPIELIPSPTQRAPLYLNITLERRT